MSKFPSFPTLLDDCKAISISFLRKHGYLIADQTKWGTITWSRGERKTGSISIRVNMQPQNEYLELDYKCNEKPIKYRVDLVSLPSNIGKGVVWYFICPHTGRRCRKLHLVQGYFYHRSAFRGCLYEKQTLSHKSRNSFKYWEKALAADKIFDKIYSKHFKKQYNGKPTKQYQKLMQKAEISKAIISQGMTKRYKW